MIVSVNVMQDESAAVVGMPFEYVLGVGTSSRRSNVTNVRESKMEYRAMHYKQRLFGSVATYNVSSGFAWLGGVSNGVRKGGFGGGAATTDTKSKGSNASTIRDFVS